MVSRAVVSVSGIVKKIPIVVILILGVSVLCVVAPILRERVRSAKYLEVVILLLMILLVIVAVIVVPWPMDLSSISSDLTRK